MWQSFKYSQQYSLSLPRLDSTKLTFTLLLTLFWAVYCFSSKELATSASKESINCNSKIGFVYSILIWNTQKVEAVNAYYSGETSCASLNGQQFFSLLRFITTPYIAQKVFDFAFILSFKRTSDSFPILNFLSHWHLQCINNCQLLN